MVEDSALARLQRNKEALELHAQHFVAQLALTWEDPRGLPDLPPTTDDCFARWVRSQADDLDTLLHQVHRLRSMLAALEHGCRA
jgi:hypothetical protein